MPMFSAARLDDTLSFVVLSSNKCWNFYMILNLAAVMSFRNYCLMKCTKYEKILQFHDFFYCCCCVLAVGTEIKAAAKHL